MSEPYPPIGEHPDLRNLGMDTPEPGSSYVTAALQSAAELLNESPVLINLNEVPAGGWVSIVTAPEGGELTEYQLYKSPETVGAGETKSSVWFWMNHQDEQGEIVPIEVKPSGSCRADGSLAEHDTSLNVRQGTYTNLMPMVTFRDPEDAPDWVREDMVLILPEESPGLEDFRHMGVVVDVDGVPYWRMRATLDSSSVIGPVSSAELME